MALSRASRPGSLQGGFFIVPEQSQSAQAFCGETMRIHEEFGGFLLEVFWTQAK